MMSRRGFARLLARGRASTVSLMRAAPHRSYKLFIGLIPALACCQASTGLLVPPDFEQLKRALLARTTGLAEVGQSLPRAHSGRALKNWRLWWPRAADLLGVPFVADLPLADALDPEFLGLADLQLPTKVVPIDSSSAVLTNV